MATTISLSGSAISRYCHDGVTRKTTTYNSGTTTISGSTTFEMIKLPFGAKVIDAWCYVTCGASALNASANINYTATIPSITIGQITRATTGVPNILSDSPQAMPRYKWAMVKVVPGTATRSVKISLCVTYEFNKKQNVT